MTSNHSNWYLETYKFANQFWAPNTSNTSHYAQWPDLPVLTFSTDFIAFSGDTFAAIPFYLLSAGVIGFATYWFILSSECNVFLTSLFAFGEKEINAIDDLLVTLLLIFVFFFFNFLGCFAFLFNCSYSLGFSVLFLGLCFMLVSIPTAMVYNFGFYFIISIRGGATTLSYVYELMLDYVNLVSFALRLCIQLVRIIVIGVTYYAYEHMFFVHDYLITPSTGGLIQDSYQLSDYLILLARGTFEIAHTIVTFAIQVIAFSVMILWLFQFLFTLFFAETLELSFLKRSTS